MKPQLASDAVLDKLVYPVYFQPKIDGVRALNITGTLTGRSLDPFTGFGVTDYFSRKEFQFLDGEMTLGDDPKAEGLCRLTTGALTAFKGVTEMANFHWWLFDCVNDDLKHLPYSDRFDLLTGYVDKLLPQGLAERLHVVPCCLCENREEADRMVAQALDDGYEGGIFRNQNAAAKEGRPSTKLQELVRVKPWTTSEILVTRLTQGFKNTNAAKQNTLGRTERSSAKAGMVPNGEVASVIGNLLADVYHPFIHDKLLFPAGKEVEVSAGEMKVAEAKHYWENPTELIGRVATIKHLAHGVHEKVRMGTFVSIRLPQDMS